MFFLRMRDLPSGVFMIIFAVSSSSMVLALCPVLKMATHASGVHRAIAAQKSAHAVVFPKRLGVHMRHS